MRFVAGQDLNLLERARAITPSPAADALFPVARLYDGYADGIFRFGSNAANPLVTVDLAILDSSGGDNGNLDTWSAGLPAAWSVIVTGTGAVTQEGALVRSGSAARLVKGTGTAKILKTYRVRAGERLTIEIYARLVSAGGVGSLQLYNPITKKYLTSGGVWQTAQAYWATEGGTAYAQKTLPLTVEDFAANQSGTAYLELTADDTSTNGFLVEDAYIWPTWNAAAIVGHNIDPGMVTELRSSTDNFGASNVLEATLAPKRPAFYGYMIAPAAKRYARVAMTGTQSTQAGAAYAGELAVCYLETAARGQLDGWETQFLEDQVRNTARSGKVYVTPLTTDARRVLRLSFKRVSDATFREGRDELIGRCNGGQWPAIIVPSDADDVVVHGRLDSSWRSLRVLKSFWQDDVTLSENPLPLVTS